MVQILSFQDHKKHHVPGVDPGPGCADGDPAVGHGGGPGALHQELIQDKRRLLYPGMKCSNCVAWCS